MTTQTDSIQVAARDLQVGDLINGARITRIGNPHYPAVVYVWIDSGRHMTGADMVFNHGDPVRITHDPDPAAVRAMFNSFGWTTTNP